MNISLFGMKINVTMLLFIVIILILIAHTYCGCNNNPYALIEGFPSLPSTPSVPSTSSLQAQASSAQSQAQSQASSAQSQAQSQESSAKAAAPSAPSTPSVATNAASVPTGGGGGGIINNIILPDGAKVSTEKTGFKVQGKKKKEGFTGLQRNIGQYSPYSLNSEKINTDSWNSPNMVITPGQPVSPEVKAFLNRPKQPVPLPQGELDLFFNTQFKPECCPNTFSRSDGCACMTGEQYNYLILRGGNNVPYSNY
jgi:hypothetical protein